MTKGISNPARITAALLAFLVVIGSIFGTALANPFETLPGDHWAYGTRQSPFQKGVSCNAMSRIALSSVIK